MNNKTAVVAPAIKIKFWKQIYKNFCRGKTHFHFVFVGHIRPSFKLPDNFTYIYCELGAAECAEIAYRYVYKHLTDFQYIINVADDAIVDEHFLDKLTHFYTQKVKELDNDFLIVGPMFNGYFDEENLMAFYDSGPILLGPMLTTIDNSKKIGGIDKRFKAIYWDCDRHLRAHMMGANVLFAPVDQVPPVKEGEWNPTGGLWNKFSGHDHTLLKDLWLCEESGDKTMFCSTMNNINGRPTNIISQKNINLIRKENVMTYNDENLEEYYE
jgi:hypothetical protein